MFYWKDCGFSSDVYESFGQAIKGALNSSSVHFFEESELEELCGTCGLVEYSRIRRGQFIMISAKRAQDIRA
jgi:hypothetical protein